MLKPIFIDNGMSYDDYFVETCLLIEEEHIQPLLDYIESIYKNNYEALKKDAVVKHIYITPSTVFDYLKEHNIQYHEFDVDKTLIRLD